MDFGDALIQEPVEKISGTLIDSETGSGGNKG